MVGLPPYYEKKWRRDFGSIQRRLIRLWAYVRPPWAPPENTKLEFELEPPSFRILRHGQLRYQGLPVPVASWDPEERNVAWCLHDESIPPESVEWLAQLLNPEVRGLFQTGLQKVEPREALLLASWAANQLGYLATYPLTWTGGRTLFLAVKPKPTTEDELGATCLYCLADEEDVDEMIEFAHDIPVGICTGCAVKFMTSKVPPDSGKDDFPCVACGSRGPRIFNLHPSGPAAFCMECLTLVAEAIVDDDEEDDEDWDEDED